MPNKDYLVPDDENYGMPSNWTPIETPTVNPSQAALATPTVGPKYFQGSFPPNFQHDVSYVNTETQTPSAPKFSLIPLNLQSNSISNAGIQSTAHLTAPASTTTTINEVGETIGVNLQTATSYIVQTTDLDKVVSVNNSAGGSIYLPPFNAPGQAPLNITTTFTPASGTSIAQAMTPTTQINQGDTIFVSLLALPSTGTTLPIVSSITDSNGNAYALAAPNFYVDLAGRNDLVTCYVAIANATVTTADTLTITIDFAASATPSNIVSFSVAGFYKKLQSASANGAVVGGTFSCGSSIGVSEDSFFLSVVGSTNTSTTSTFTGIVTGGGGNEIGVAYFYDTGSVTDDWTGSGFFADTLIAFQAPVVSGALSAFTDGYFVYVENTGTGPYTVYSGANIDGQAQAVTVETNQGLLFVWNGTGWYTVRGLGLSTAILSINGDTTPHQVIAGGSGITVSTVAGTTTISSSGGGSAQVQLFGYPEATFVALNPSGSVSWNSTPMNGAANRIVLFPFYIPFTIGVKTLSIAVITADATNQYDMGFYDSGLNWINSLGPTSFSSTSSPTNPTVLTFLNDNVMTAGLNYFAVTSSALGNLAILAAYDVWRSPWQLQDTSVSAGAWLTSGTASSGSTLPTGALSVPTGTPKFIINDSVIATPVFAIAG